VAVLIWRFLPEPARGGQSRLPAGAAHVRPVEDVPAGERRAPDRDRAGGRERVEREAVRAGARPVRRNVLRGDPVAMSWTAAVRHVLSVRTNVVLIVASSLAYYFLAGVRTFAVVFFRGRYDLSQSIGTALFGLVGLGAMVGIVAGGRIADRLIGRGHHTARIDVAMASYLLAALLFLPGLLSGDMAVAMPLFFLAAAALAAGSAPTDAARLDIIHFRLWGRAESVRTFLRTVLQAVAPLVFGFISDVLGGGQAAFGRSSGLPPHHAQGLDIAFLLMLVPLAAAGVILLVARRTYPEDVATAAESERRAA
jgi:MFS family permease